MPTMKLPAITVRQPFASLLAAGIKTVETRSRPTLYRGPILLIAGLSWHWNKKGLYKNEGVFPYIAELLRNTNEMKSVTYPAYDALPRGVILARLNLVECLTAADYILKYYMNAEKEALLGNLSVEFGRFAPAHYAYRMEVEEVFTKPIPARGQLGIFDAEKLNTGLLEKLRGL
jgi:hypothetical protein